MRDSTRFVNRELSWLRFNSRVLAEARGTRNPLLERARFLSIVSSNLDEFFMVRIGKLERKIESGVPVEDPSGMAPGDILKAAQRAAARQVGNSTPSIRRTAARPHGGGHPHPAPGDLSPEQRQWLDGYFHSRACRAHA